MTRVGMYVCFGFPVDRLRRARTIDLQCQSLSLSSFLLCNVTASVTRTVDFRWPARPQNRSKIIAKIDRKSIPGEASGHSKSIENRSPDPLGTLRGLQGRLEGVSGASRERPGASPARPGSARRASRGALGIQNHRPGVPGSKPRRPKSTPSRIRERKHRVFVARRVRETPSDR